MPTQSSPPFPGAPFPGPLFPGSPSPSASLPGLLPGVLPGPLPPSLQQAGAIILATKPSMQSPGKAEALLTVQGASLLSRGIRSLQKAGIQHILVLTGAQADRVAQEAARHGAKAVFAKDYARNAGSSLRTALAAFQRFARPNAPFFILPVTACLVRPQSPAALLASMAALPEGIRKKSLLIPAFADQPGYPVLLGPAHLDGIRNSPEARRGLRDYIASLLPDNAAKRFLSGAIPDTGLAALPGSPRPLPFSAAPVGSKNGSTLYFLHLPDAHLLDSFDEPNALSQAITLRKQTRGGLAPLPEEALDWLLHSGSEEWKIRHGIAVALGALRLNMQLDGAEPVDPLLAVCGGLLHDVARRHKRHAHTAMHWIRAWGWPEPALVAGVHTRFPAAYCRSLGFAPIQEEYFGPAPQIPRKRQNLIAAASVYLADKYFYGDRLVSIAERFNGVKSRFADNAQAIRGIVLREETSGKMARWFAEKTEREAMAVVAEPCAHPLENFLQNARKRAFPILQVNPENTVSPAPAPAGGTAPQGAV